MLRYGLLARKNLEVCRLLTRGTIEEKVYHRQFYKHALSTRVLSDPRQRRFVSSAGVRDLFTLSDKRSEGTPHTPCLYLQPARYKTG